MANLFSYGPDASGLLYRGIEKAAAAVCPSLGPSGRSAALSAVEGNPHVTFSGDEIARCIALEDPFEQMGARLLLEAMERTVDTVGDGGTTTAVLLHTMAGEAVRCIAAGLEPNTVNRGISRGVSYVLRDLQSCKAPAKQADILEDVATQAAHDRILGSLIMRAVASSATDALITVEESASGLDELTFSGGMQIDRGYFSSMLPSGQPGEAHTLYDPLVLITDQQLSDFRALLPAVEAASQSGRGLFILADDLTPGVLGPLIANSRAGKLLCTAVQAPDFGARRMNILQDIAALTGAVVLSPSLGIPADHIKLEQLGQAATVTVNAERTVITVGQPPQSLQPHVAFLRRQLNQATSPERRTLLRKRIGNLTGGCATLRAGGATPAEASERRERMARGLRAVESARLHGVLAGGGTVGAALSLRLAALAETESNSGIRAGLRLVSVALAAPFAQLKENIGGIQIDNPLWEPANLLPTALSGSASTVRLLLSTGCLAATQETPSSTFYQKFRSYNMLDLHRAYASSGTSQSIASSAAAEWR